MKRMERGNETPLEVDGMTGYQARHIHDAGGSRSDDCNPRWVGGERLMGAVILLEDTERK